MEIFWGDNGIDAWIKVFPSYPLIVAYQRILMELSRTDQIMSKHVWAGENSIWNHFPLGETTQSTSALESNDASAFYAFNENWLSAFKSLSKPCRNRSTKVMYTSCWTLLADESLGMNHLISFWHALDNSVNVNWCFKLSRTRIFLIKVLKIFFTHVWFC